MQRAPTPPAQPASGPGGADYRHRDVAASYGTGATQFWLFDALTDAAFYGKNREYALGNTPQQRYMGAWSDGRPVRELVNLDSPCSRPPL